MSPYTTANITLLRTKHIASPTWRLSIAPMSKLKIWSGLVNTSTTRGLSTIYFDGGTLYNGASYSDLLAGQLLTVQTSKSLVRLRLKSLTGTATSGTLTVGENNTVWADNLPLTIYRDYPLFGIRPKISAAGVFYKDENVAYVDENQYPPPVAIMGPDWAGWLSGDPATLDATDSYPMTYGATIASYLWTVEPTVGATIASPASSTTTISFTIAGPYWVKLQVTDTNGNIGYTRALFHAHDTTTYPPFAVARATFASDFDRSGGETDFAASDVDSLDLIPAYGRMTLWSEDRLDGVLTTANGGWSGREHIKRVSYITKDSIKRIPGSHQVSFSASTVLDMLDRIANYSVSLKYLATPTTWFEYGNRGITVAQALHHLWKWHSTLFEIASVYLPTSNDLRAYAVDDFERGSLLSQARTFAFQHGIFAQIACTDQGVIHVEQDAQLFPTIIPAGFTLAEGDWEKEMDLERQPIPECNFVDLSGFGFDGSYNTPLLSQAPGYVIAEVGARELQFTRCILDDQAASNVLSGRLLAKENNETPTLSLTLTAPLSLGNTFQVVPQKWHDLTLAVDETARIDWSAGIDLVVRRIETEYTPGSCIQRLTFEPYSEGEDGIIGNYPIPVTPDLTGKCWEMRLDPDNLGVKTIPLPNGGTLTAYTGYSFFEVNCPSGGGGGQQPPDVPDIPEDDELPDILYPDCDGALVLPNPIADITICWDTDEGGGDGGGGGITIDTGDGEGPVDITPDVPLPNTCGDATAPTMDDVTIVKVFAPTSPPNTLYALVKWQAPTGEWRSWIVVSHDLGQTWEAAEQAQGYHSGNPGPEISLLLGTEGNWSHDATGGDPTVSGGLEGWWSALTNPSSTQSVTLPQSGYITMWGTLTRYHCPSCCLLVCPEGTYDSGVWLDFGPQQLLWSGDSGFKIKSGWVDAGTYTFSINFSSGGAGICMNCGAEYPFGRVANVGLCYTADIPAAGPSCEGLELSDIVGNSEDGNEIYVIGWDPANSCITITTFNVTTATYSTPHCVMTDVTEAEWLGELKSLQLKSIYDPVNPGYGATLYAYGTDNTNAVVYVSTDSGATWASAGTGLPAGETITALATIGDGGGGLVDNYAFGSDSKVYKQTGGTGAWGTGTAIPIIPVSIDVGQDINHTIVAKDATGVVMTAPSPYTTWTTQPGTHQNAFWDD